MATQNMDSVKVLDEDKELVMSMAQIQEWNPDLSSYLHEMDEKHRDALDWIYQSDNGLRQKYANRDHTVNIYNRSYGKCMRCNLCWEFTKIAVDALPERTRSFSRSRRKASVPMAEFHAPISCKFSVLDLKSHLSSASHDAVCRYITFMRIKTAMITHEFGGHPKVADLLQDAVSKLTHERRDEILEQNIQTLRAVGKWNEDKRSEFQWASLRMIDPPFYPLEFDSDSNSNPNINGGDQGDQDPIAEVLSRLDETLLFNSDQKLFLEHIIRRCVQQSAYLHPTNSNSNLNSNHTPSPPFKIKDSLTDSSIISVPNTLNDDPTISKMIQVITVTKPLIMKRLFQCLIKDVPLNQSVDPKALSSKLQNVKALVMRDLQKMNVTASNNLNPNRRIWEFQDLEIGLLFDIHCIYRIDQYVNRGIFDTTLTMLRDRIGCKELDNKISMEEATVFKDAAQRMERDLVQPLRFEKMYIINGRVTEYMVYIFALSSMLKKVLIDTEMTMEDRYCFDLRFQCDLVLIANSVLDVFTRKEVTAFNHNDDIASNLNAAHIPFVSAPGVGVVDWSDFHGNLLKRKVIKNVLERLWMELMGKIDKMDGNHNGIRNQRVVVVVDKRRNINPEHDTLYMFASKGTVEPLQQQSLELCNDNIMHYLTQKYLLPQSNGNWIGAVDAVNGRLLTYSFHIHALDVHRCYLSFCGGTTRSFPEHFVDVVPKYFVCSSNVDKKRKKEKFIELLYSHDYKHGFDLYLKDEMFVKYYRRLTGYFHVSVNYRRTKIQTATQLQMDGNNVQKEKINERMTDAVISIAEEQMESNNQRQKPNVIMNGNDNDNDDDEKGKEDELLTNDLKLKLQAMEEKEPEPGSVDLDAISNVNPNQGGDLLTVNDDDQSVVSEVNLNSKSNQSTNPDTNTLNNKSNESESVDKEFSELNVEEMYHVVVDCVTRLKLDIDADKLRDELKLDGPMLAMKKKAKDFWKILKPFGINGSQSRKLWNEITTNMDKEAIAAVLKQYESNDDDLKVNDDDDLEADKVSAESEANGDIDIDALNQDDEGQMLHDKPLETLSVDEFCHLFVCIARKLEIFTDYDTLHKCVTVITEQNIDGQQWMAIKSGKEWRRIVNPFKSALSLPSGRLLKDLKKIREWTVSDDATPSAIARKLLEPRLCSGKLEECSNIAFLVEILEKFHNKSTDELMTTILPDVDVIRVLNCYHHLKTVHCMYGQEGSNNHNDSDDDDDDNDNDGDSDSNSNESLSADDEYARYQYKIHDFVTKQIGHCQCDANNCYFILRHGRVARRHDRASMLWEKYDDSTNGLILDVMAKIHTQIFHRVGNQLYRLYDAQRARNGEYKDEIAININPTELDEVQNEDELKSSDQTDHDSKEDDSKNDTESKQIANPLNFKIKGLLKRQQSVEWLDEDGNRSNAKYLEMDSDSDSDEEKEVPPSKRSNFNKNRSNLKNLSLRNLGAPDLMRRTSSRFVMMVDDPEDEMDEDLDIIIDDDGDDEKKENDDSLSAMRSISAVSRDPSSPRLSSLSPIPSDSSIAVNGLSLSMALSRDTELKEDKSHDKHKGDSDNSGISGIDPVQSPKMPTLPRVPSSVSKYNLLSVPGQQVPRIKKKKKKRRSKRADILPLLFGQRLDDWFGPLVTPIFDNMHDEVTQNKYNPIAEDVWQTIKTKCLKLIHTSQNEMEYNLEEMMALKLYTDCDQLCTMLRRTFWEKTPIHQKQSVFHWTMNLQKVMCYGATPLKPRIRSVYHGLSKLFTVKNLRPRFNGPISTSKNVKIAKNFTQEKGVVWQIKPRRWSELELPLGIDIEELGLSEYEEGEIVLMNCPLPIKKSTFSSDKERNIQYLLDYLEKYNEEIKDKNDFWKMVGLDKAAGITKLREGENMHNFDELLIRLGRNPRLWTSTQRPLSISKLKRSFNREFLNDDYWNDLLEERMAKIRNETKEKEKETNQEEIAMESGQNAKDSKEAKESKDAKDTKESKDRDRKKEGEDDRPYAYGHVIHQIFSNQYQQNSRQFCLEHGIKNKHHFITEMEMNKTQRRHHNEKKERDRRKVVENRLEREGAIQILSLLRGVPTNQITVDPHSVNGDDDDESEINLVKQSIDDQSDSNSMMKPSDEQILREFIGKQEREICNLLTNHTEVTLLNLNLSVYHRLVNKLDLIYLPFAAFTRVHFNGPKVNVDLSSSEKRRQHNRHSNLFQYARAASIRHLDEGMPLLQEMCRKHRVKYKLQFRFRPDKRASDQENYYVLDQVLKNAFIGGIKLSGSVLLRIQDDPEMLMQRCEFLAKVAQTTTQVIEEIFGILRRKFNASQLREINAPQLYAQFKSELDRMDKTDYDSLKKEFVAMELDGERYMRIQGDEFKMMMRSLRLAKAAHIPPGDVLMVFEDFIDDGVYKDEMSCEQLYEVFERQMRRNVESRMKKEVRKGDYRFRWQYIEIGVDQIRRRPIFLNVADCANFSLWNEENIWNYKLTCCVEDVDPDKWVEIDKNRCVVDLDCVVPEYEETNIHSFKSTSKILCRKKKMHDNVWIFRSLRLQKGSKLTVHPFGFNFIDKELKTDPDNGEGGDDPHFHFGCIRIFCYEDLILEEDASIDVNGKGMFGSPLTDHLNLGRGGHVQWRRNRKVDPGNADNIYSGGGYGSQGHGVVDNVQGMSRIVQSRQLKGDSDTNQEIKWKKTNRNEGTEIVPGGMIFGDERLDTLHYGSSGGRGCLEKEESSKADYYQQSDRGGGIIELIAQRIIIKKDAKIMANGKPAWQGGKWFSCGSGGSIKIRCHEFINDGQIEAVGGRLPDKVRRRLQRKDANYTPLHGEGGHGRIAIYCDEYQSDDGKINPVPYRAKSDEFTRSEMPRWEPSSSD